jgi:putative endonuclease
MAERKTDSRRLELGRRAEESVAVYLQKKGFEIVARNERVGHLEIDIIAKKGSLIVFCEVRSRTNDAWMTPAQSLTETKIKRLRRAATQWLISAQPNAVEVRFDVASVVYDVPRGTIDYFEDAF